MRTIRYAGQRNSLGISIGATNLAASYRGQTVVQPAVVRTARGGWLSGFVDRIGDPVPLVAADGTTHRAEALLATALEATIASATHGAPVSSVSMAVPAHWAPSTVAALQAGAPPHSRLVSDATAAAWALHADAGLPSRGVVVVCDFGGSGTSITLLDAAAEFGCIGDTARIGDFSGDHVDQAVLGKVVAELSDAGRMDPTGTAMVGSLARLRQACRLAKHRLSAETATAIAVELPDLTTSIRLTRPELEALVAAPMARVLTELDDVLARNDIAPQGVSAVLTTGGSARMPLVTQLLSQHLRTSIVTSPHPQLTAASGAALLAARAQSDDPRTELSRTALAAAAAHAAVPDAQPVVTSGSALAWSQAEPDDVDDADALVTSRPDLEYEHHWDDVPPEPRTGPLLAFLASATAAAAALAVYGLTSYAHDPDPASVVSTVAESTAPVSTAQPAPAPVSQVPVSQVAGTQTVVVVTPPPRLVPVGQPAAPATTAAPVVTTKPPPPVTTTTATPTTTTTTTPPPSTSTTPPTSTTTTSNSTSTTTTPTSAPELTT